MKTYDVIIIGGGASGMMCALNVDKSQKVLIIEKNKSLGKKILVTGNGRCNLTNLNMSSKFFNTNIDKFLNKMNATSAVKYFNDLGLMTYSDNEGRVYPITNSAKSVADVLNYYVNSNKNIEVLTGVEVIKVKSAGNNIVVCDNNVVYCAKNIVMATGNLSYNIFDKSIVNCTVPSLVALKTLENTKNFEGLKLSNVTIVATCNGKSKKEFGEVLFKDHGLSGISIFNISALFARNKCFEGEISIDILPSITQNRLVTMIKKRATKFKLAKDVLMGIILDPIRNEIFSRCKISESKMAIKLNDGEIDALAKMIKNFTFNITGHYENNQVISGGVDPKYLNDNLELKNCPNVYIIGEACDVDGECGGYNLQWAWISGFIVGKSIK